MEGEWKYSEEELKKFYNAKVDKVKYKSYKEFEEMANSFTNSYLKETLDNFKKEQENA